MSVDLSPILSTLIQLGAIALMALGGVAIQRLATKLGLDARGAVAQQLDDALNKSIAAGAMSASEVIRERGWDHPVVKNLVVGGAAQYLALKWPDLLKKAGIDAGNPAYARDEILALLNRAYPTAMAPIAASPVTPPATPAVAAATTAPEK